MCLISSNTAFLQCIVPAEWLIETRIINHIAYASAKTAGNLNQKVWYLHPSTWSVTSLQAYEFLVIDLRHLQIHHSNKFAYFFRWRLLRTRMLVVLQHVDVVHLTLQICESEGQLTCVTETLSSVLESRPTSTEIYSSDGFAIHETIAKHSYAGSVSLTLLQHLTFTGITEGPVEGWVRQALQVCWLLRFMSVCFQKLVDKASFNHLQWC